MKFYFDKNDGTTKELNYEEVREHLSHYQVDEATDSVCAIIPAVLKPIIKRDFVKAIVQAAFDRIEAYAKKQVEKKGKRGE